MLKKQSLRLLVAVVILAILAVAYWYWATKATVKLALTGLSPASAGAVALTYAYPGKDDPSAWVGKKVTIRTKSLGTIHSTVASASAQGLTTAAGAVTGSAASYVADDGDCARVMLKY